jgi:hypothetical protein
MSSVPRPPNDLFRQLAAAQDRALAGAARRPLALPPPGAPARARRAPRRVLLAACAGAFALALVAGGALWQATRPLRFEVGASGRAGAPGMALVARADTHLPLRFSDGSSLTFQPGAEGRVLRLSEAGADVVLDRGRLVAAIEHADRTRWQFSAGPFRIRVVGTRFSADWAPATVALVVALHEGAVVVDGPGLAPGGLRVSAGERLEVNGETRRIALGPIEAFAGAGGPPGGAAIPPAAPPAAAGAAGAPSTGVPSTGVPSTGVPSVAVRSAPAAADPPRAGWMTLAERGEHAAALRAARRAGLPALCASLPPEPLLALGDVARFAGARGEATRLFECLARRFPRHALAGDAVFTLGRLAFEAGQADAAARWFERYGARWPRGAFAEEAAGRLVESHARAGSVGAARAAAAAYLGAHPNGPHAPLARRLAGDGGP